MAIKYGRPIEPANLYPLEAPAGRTAPILDLVHRPRRTRRTDWARRLVRENTLTVDDLIWPIFVVDGVKTRVPVASMPGVERLSVDEAVKAAERAASLEIPVLSLFPYTDPARRTEDAARGAQPRQPRQPRDARHQGGGAGDRHLVPTSRSIPTPATAMTG